MRRARRRRISGRRYGAAPRLAGATHLVRTTGALLAWLACADVDVAVIYASLGIGALIVLGPLALRCVSSSLTFRFEMRIRRHASPALLLGRARAFLLQAEAENGIFLGMGGWKDATRPVPQDCYLATIEHRADVVACAARTPPYGLNITRATLSALECLIDDLARKYRTLPAVRGPEPTVSDFAGRWCARVGTRARPIMRMRVFRADSVRFPERRAAGTLRAASERDLRAVEPWVTAFHEEAGTGIPIDPIRATHEQVAERRLFLWDHGGPVSMAVVGRPTRHGMGIEIVYTPPEHRRQGYASMCVAAVTERLLSGGATTCYINADVMNRTTNRIYPAIGYRSVCELSNIALDAV